MEYIIRKARPDDWEFVKRLLLDICSIHKGFRPDLFKDGGLKFSVIDFENMLEDDNRFVHICENVDGERLAYLFSKINIIENSDMRTDRRILYLDDICVERSMRGKGVGSSIVEFSKSLALDLGCDSIELNAWAENFDAISLYEKNGFKMQRAFYEYIL
jgi:GNAT superfamily N-acetyltransferase